MKVYKSAFISKFYWTLCIFLWCSLTWVIASVRLRNDIYKSFTIYTWNVILFGFSCHKSVSIFWRKSSFEFYSDLLNDNSVLCFGQSFNMVRLSASRLSCQVSSYLPGTQSYWKISSSSRSDIKVFLRNLCFLIFEIS